MVAAKPNTATGLNGACDRGRGRGSSASAAKSAGKLDVKFPDKAPDKAWLREQLNL
jgi:hypothetical protein